MRYGDNNRVALAELADIKDRGLEKARKKWEAERESLFRQVQLILARFYISHTYYLIIFRSVIWRGGFRSYKNPVPFYWMKRKYLQKIK